MIFLLFLASLLSFSKPSNVGNLIKFEFITENRHTISYTIKNFETILDDPKFDRSKITTIYNYGFLQTVHQPDVRKTIDAYLENGNYNFVLVNYNSILDYTVLNANEFGKIIAESLIKLFERGYGKFHIVGFSLGAQVAGVIGRCVKKLSNGELEIPRITGLDPGKLPPIPIGLMTELNAGDAAFVDTIHGETSLFGSRTSLGDASFWLYDGHKFPNCSFGLNLLDSVCSHLTTQHVFADTVRVNDANAFLATKCETYLDYKRNKCDTDVTSSMGIHASPTSKGRFYLDI